MLRKHTLCDLRDAICLFYIFGAATVLAGFPDEKYLKDVTLEYSVPSQMMANPRTNMLYKSDLDIFLKPVETLTDEEYEQGRTKFRRFEEMYAPRVVRCPCKYHNLMTLKMFADDLYLFGCFQFACPCSNRRLDYTYLVDYAGFLMRKWVTHKRLDADEKRVLAKIVYDCAREKTILVMVYCLYVPVNELAVFNGLYLNELRSIILAAYPKAVNSVPRRTLPTKPGQNTNEYDQIVNAQIPEVFETYRRAIDDLAAADKIKFGRNVDFEKYLKPLSKSYPNNGIARLAFLSKLKASEDYKSHAQVAKYASNIVYSQESDQSSYFMSKKEAQLLLAIKFVKLYRQMPMKLLVKFIQHYRAIQDEKAIVYLGLHELYDWYLASRGSIGKIKMEEEIKPLVDYMETLGNPFETASDRLLSIYCTPEAFTEDALDPIELYDPSHEDFVSEYTYVVSELPVFPTNRTYEMRVREKKEMLVHKGKTKDELRSHDERSERFDTYRRVYIMEQEERKEKEKARQKALEEDRALKRHWKNRRKAGTGPTGLEGLVISSIGAAFAELIQDEADRHFPGRARRPEERQRRGEMPEEPCTIM